MIFRRQKYDLIFWDAIYSMGAGFIVGAVYQLLSVFFYKKKLLVFIKDILISCFFTITIYSFVVSFANYKVLRWYNVAFALLGRIMFSPQFGHSCHKLFAALFLWGKNKVKHIFKEIHRKFLTKVNKKVEKTEKISQENQSEVLKQTEVILYN